MSPLIVFLNLTNIAHLVGCKWSSPKRGLGYGNKDAPWGSSCRFIIIIIILLIRVYLIKLVTLKCLLVKGGKMKLLSVNFYQEWRSGASIIH